MKKIYEIVLPKISIVLPTYQAEKYIRKCLESIAKQSYPKEKLEILVIDGGSTDKTLVIAGEYKVKIINNPDRDAESGKSIGVQKAKGEIIALIDADNELVGKNWLEEMVKPLVDDKNIFGAESPWLLRKKDPLINQYVTLLKIADPLARRFHPHMKIENRGSYDVYYLQLGQTPVVGANGFLWRKKFIKTVNSYKPKFEEVNYIALMLEHGYFVYARVKNVGIYHYYCSSVWEYIKKRVKIGKKFMARKRNGEKTWVDQRTGGNFFLAVLYNLSFILPLMESFRGYRKDKNIAWFYHPFISFLTIAVYIYIFLYMSLIEFFRYENR